MTTIADLAARIAALEAQVCALEEEVRPLREKREAEEWRFREAWQAARDEGRCIIAVGVDGDGRTIYRDEEHAAGEQVR